MINEANRWAYEYMVMRGNTPEGLNMLIKTELINGNYAVAEKFIYILDQSVFTGMKPKNSAGYFFTMGRWKPTAN